MVGGGSNKRQPILSYRENNSLPFFYFPLKISYDDDDQSFFCFVEGAPFIIYACYLSEQDL